MEKLTKNEKEIIIFELEQSKKRFEPHYLDMVLGGKKMIEKMLRAKITLENIIDKLNGK